MVKGDNHPAGDFWMQPLMQGTGAYADGSFGRDDNGVKYAVKDITGNSFELCTDFMERDFAPDKEVLYVVYEAADNKRLIARLLKAFSQSGLMDKGLVSMLGQVINVGSLGVFPYENKIFVTPEPQPLQMRLEALQKKYSVWSESRLTISVRRSDGKWVAWIGEYSENDFPTFEANTCEELVSLIESHPKEI